MKKMNRWLQRCKAAGKTFLAAFAVFLLNTQTAYASGISESKLAKADRGCYNLAHGAGTGRCRTSDYLFLHQEKCGGRDGSEEVEQPYRGCHRVLHRGSNRKCNLKYHYWLLPVMQTT